MRALGLLMTVFGLALLMWPPVTEAKVTFSGEKLVVLPQAPSPNSEAVIKLTDTSVRNVRWFVDGIEMTDANNASEITITTKDVGQETIVEARVNASTNAERVTIAPVRLDLIVGADSSVPSFYQGRALPAKAGKISVQAFVFGDSTGPFRYEWVINGQSNIDQVSRTSNQIVIEPNLANEMNVYVEVYNPSNELVAQGGVVVPLFEPEVHFYESNPLHGLIPNVLSSPYYFLFDEITVRAEPFYVTGDVNDLAIDWEIDNRKMNSDDNPLELSLLKTQESGQAVVAISIINTTNYLESAGTDIIVTY